MKTLIFSVFAIALCGYGMAQEEARQDVNFGSTMGYIGASQSYEIIATSLETQTNMGGFFFGLISEFEITPKFLAQPEFLYVNIDNNDSLLFPILGKYYVTQKLHAELGPQLLVHLETLPENTDDMTFSFVGGLGYDINKQFMFRARYAHQLSNSYIALDGNAYMSSDFISVGLGYRFL